MEHSLFLLLMTIPLVLLLVFDRKNARKYILLGIAAVLAGMVFENFTTSLGFWYHHSEPKTGLNSVYNGLLYFHYVCFSYFLGERSSRRLKWR